MSYSINEFRRKSTKIYHKEFRIYNLTLNFITNRKKLLNIFSEFVVWNSVKTFQKRLKFKFSFFDLKNLKEFQPCIESYKRFYSFENIEYFRHNYSRKKYIIIISGSIYVFINFFKKEIIILARVHKIWSDDFINYLIILPVLTFVLGYYKIFSLHAAAAVCGGRSIIFPAMKEEGKTTLMLNLLKSGFSFVSEDTLFYFKRNRKILLLAFPRQINIYNDVVKFFPEFKFRFKKKINASRYKVRFPVNKIFKDLDVVRQVRPDYVMIPELRLKNKSTCLIPISKKETYLKIFPQGLKAFNRELAELQLNLIEEMINNTKNFIIRIGNDLESIPDIIRNSVSEI